MLLAITLCVCYYVEAGLSAVLYFRVKFYVPDPAVLREEFTRYSVVYFAFLTALFVFVSLISVTSDTLIGLVIKCGNQLQ